MYFIAEACGGMAGGCHCVGRRVRRVALDNNNKKDQETKDHAAGQALRASLLSLPYKTVSAQNIQPSSSSSSSPSSCTVIIIALNGKGLSQRCLLLLFLVLCWSSPVYPTFFSMFGCILITTEENVSTVSVPAITC